MSNLANDTKLIGRLAADPRTFENSDGSKKVVMTLMIDRNYTNSKGETISDSIPVEAFIRKGIDGTGPYGYIHKGDLIGIGASLRQDRYTDKSGKEVFQLKVVAESLTFLESRAVTQARLAERVAKAEVENQKLAQAAVAAPAPAVAEEPALAADLPFGR